MENFGFVNRRVLITGATGFIGRHLVSRLLNEGAIVATFVLDEEYPLNNAPVVIFRGNIQSLSDVQRAIGRFQPEYVFHLAAQPLVDTALRSVLDTLNTNIQGGWNILHACQEYGVKHLLFVSTDKVYGNAHYASEELCLDGGGHPYNASKACADILAQMYVEVFDLPVAIVRSGNIYGEGDVNWDRLIPGVSRWIIEGKPVVLRSNGQFTRDYIYVDDIVDGYLLLAGGGHRGVYNFGSDEYHSVLDIVSFLAEASGVSPEIIIQDTARNEIPHQHLTWDKARSIGWFPKTPLEEGLKRTYEWYREYRRLT